MARTAVVFLCTHRMNVPKGITSGLSQQGNIEVVIFSERNGSQVWNAPAQVKQGRRSLTLTLESVVIPVKVNNKGKGTCSAADRPDPTTGQKDGIKDLHCQFHVAGITLPTGTIFAVVSGFFLDPTTGEVAGIHRQTGGDHSGRSVGHHKRTTRLRHGEPKRINKEGTS